MRPILIIATILWGICSYAFAILNHQEQVPVAVNSQGKLRNEGVLQPNVASPTVNERQHSSVDIVFKASSLWVGPNDVVVSQNMAFFAMVHGLMVADITNPQSPVIISRTVLSTSANMKLFVLDTLAFVACAEAGLCILNVADPSAPEVLSCTSTSSSAAGVYVRGNQAVVTCGAAGIAVFDVSNPLQPIHLSTLDTKGDALAVSIVDSLAYIAVKYYGLVIASISNPSIPYIVGVDSIDHVANSVCTQGSYAYLADGSRYILSIIDTSNPASPITVGRLANDDWHDARDVVVKDTLAFVACGDHSDVLNISVKQSPTLSYSTGGSIRTYAAMCVGVGDSVAVVCYNVNSIEIYSLTTTGSSGSIQMPKYMTSLQAAADVAFVLSSSHWGRLVQAMDFASSLNPLPVSLGMPDDGEGWAMSQSAGRLCVSGEYPGLAVFDVSVPSEPALLTQWSGRGSFRELAMDDERLFAFDDTALVFVDIADSLIHIIDVIPRGKIAVSGSLLLVTAGIQGRVRVFDVSDPLMAQERTPLWIWQNTTDVDIKGNYAYVSFSDVFSGIDVFDITNPDAPIRVQRIYCDGSPTDIEVGPYFAVVAAADAGIQVFGLTGSGRLEHWGGYQTNGSAFAVALSNTGAFVLDPGGLTVLDLIINYLCGDADGNDIITISDAVYLINYIFAGGPGSNPVLAGDADCSGAITVSDAVSLISYIFAGGAAPCAACP